MSGLVVETRSGAVQGITVKSKEGFDYSAFKGIPYAKPPIGDLRFKDPVPIEKWTDIRDATEYGSNCAQYDIISRGLSDNEDCLYLNIYTTTNCDFKNTHKAVMVWIHGGGFLFGTPSDEFYGPDYLIRKDIILVTIGYRLGVFGFLDLEHEVAPGNQGLKDQILALRWIKSNIQAFGGDPDNITIFGESAGGMSVHYLALSPITKGLFHKAISQSGIAFNPWARIEKPKNNARRLCSILGKNLVDPEDIVEFLKTIDSKLLCESQEKLRREMGTLPFGPGIDDKSHYPVLSKPVEEAAKRGVHIPYLTGYNSRQGIFFLLGIRKKDALAAMNLNFEKKLTTRSLQVLKSYDLRPNQFKRLYYKSEHVSDENIEQFVDLMGDLCFVEGIHKFIKVQAEKSSAPTYLYQFSYDPGFSLIKSMAGENISGAAHFDEVAYLFKMQLLEKLGLPQIRRGTEDYEIMERMTELWTNFAKYGNPTNELSELIPLHWQPVGDGTILRYLNIDEDLTMQYTLNIERKFLSARDIRG